MPDIWVLVAICAKAILYFGVLTGTGLVLVRVMFASLTEPVSSALRTSALASAVMAALAALCGYALRGAALTGDASGITDPAILGMMWQTPVGTALALRMSGLGLMIVGLFVTRFGGIIALIGAGIALWSFAAIGHVADGTQIWLQLVLFLHLVVASFWIGILLPLGRLASTPETMAAAGTLGHRFGQVASIAIPLLLVAGILLSVQLVGSWTALWGSNYGIALVAKVTLVAGLLALGALNKFRVVPALWNGHETARAEFAKVLLIEWGIFVVVLVATAILTTNFALPGK